MWIVWCFVIYLVCLFARFLFSLLPTGVQRGVEDFCCAPAISRPWPYPPMSRLRGLIVYGLVPGYCLYQIVGLGFVLKIVAGYFLAVYMVVGIAVVVERVRRRPRAVPVAPRIEADADEDADYPFLPLSDYGEAREARLKREEEEYLATAWQYDRD